MPFSQFVFPARFRYSSGVQRTLKMILVVGATGQLGTAIVRQLIERGLPVRALVRERSNYAGIKDSGADIAFGDLRDRTSFEAACNDVDTIIATANTAI